MKTRVALTKRAVIVLAAAAAIVIGCVGSDGALTGIPRPVAPPSKLLEGLNLLSCSTQSADSVTQVVDSAGGTIYVGPHVFTIPAGALDTAVSITAVAPAVDRREVRFQPEGLTFRSPASLTLDYHGCGLIGELLFTRKIVYTDGSLNPLELISSLDNLLAKQVTGQVEHFSGYVVWY